MPFFYQKYDAALGPYTGDELQALAAWGFIEPNTLVRKNDGEWMAAKKINGLWFKPKPKVPLGVRILKFVFGVDDIRKL